jgi:hypothetical protein
MRRLVGAAILAGIGAALAPVPTAAQPAAQVTAPASDRAPLARRFAPIDLTGTWVSVVTEDWAVRMITPPKGDFESLPLTRAAQDAASRIDMAQVTAAGRACDAYGAPVIMRQPGRVRIAWTDDSTLRIETDAGQQTRLLRFGGGSPGAPSRQGLSVAEWQYANGFDPVRAAAVPAARGADAASGSPQAGRGGRGRGAPLLQPMGGRLKVTTTNLLPGFLRKNGVPYSAASAVTEFFNLIAEPTGTQWFVVTTVVHDSENLVVDYITSSNFRKEPDGSKWSPQPCALQ